MAEIENGGQGDTGAPTEASKSFIAGLGEGNSSNEIFKGLENSEQLGTKYSELHAKNAELSTQHETLKGSIPKLPDSIDAYKYQVPEGYNLKQGDADIFREFAFKNKLSPEQYSNSMDVFVARDKKELEEHTEKKEKAIATLKTEMGVEYDANLERVQKVLRHPSLGGSEEFLKDADVANNPRTFKWILGISKHISEDILELEGTKPGQGSEIQRDGMGNPVLKFGDEMPKPK